MNLINAIIFNDKLIYSYIQVIYVALETIFSKNKGIIYFMLPPYYLIAAVYSFIRIRFLNTLLGAI